MRLGIAQPAVSQQLARPERELGLRLLVRSPHRVALTDDGARLLVEARATLAAADRLRLVAADLVHGRRATLRLGTGPGLGLRMPGGVSTLRARYPGVQFVLVEGTAAAHAADVAAGELDAAPVRGATDTPRMRAVEVGEDALAAVLPPGHPAAGKEAVRFTDLADLRCGCRPGARTRCCTTPCWPGPRASA